MGSFFNPENRFWTFMNKMTDIIFVSVLWLICSLPIITVGASTTALFNYTLKLSKNIEGSVTKTFFKAFKTNFIKSTILWFGMILIGAVIYLDAYLFLQINNVYGNILFFVIICLGILFLITCLYIFPILALFKSTVKEIIKDAFVMGIGNLHITIAMIAIIIASAYLTYTYPILSFFITGFISYINSFLYQYVFDKYLIAK